MKKVTLVRGFKRKQKDEEVEVLEVDLREPTSGELRGLKVFDVIQMDVTSCRQLIPRISMMTANEFDLLGAKDLAILCNEVAAFFVE